MKRILLCAMLALTAVPAMADLDVSIGIGSPGFFGHIDIGDDRPDVINTRPVIIERGPPRGGPVYLRVKPGYERNWAAHCREYDACGQEVYFVRDTWYERVYVPKYRERHPVVVDRRPVVVQQRTVIVDKRPDNGRGRDDHDDHDDHGRGRGPDGNGPPGHDKDHH